MDLSMSILVATASRSAFLSDTEPKSVSSEKEQALTIQHTVELLNDSEATVKQKIRRDKTGF